MESYSKVVLSNLPLILSILAFLISLSTFYFNFLRRGKLVIGLPTRATFFSAFFRPCVDIMLIFHNPGTQHFFVNHVAILIRNMKEPDDTCLINAIEIIEGKFVVSGGEVKVAPQRKRTPFESFLLTGKEKVAMTLNFFADGVTKYRFKEDTPYFFKFLAFSKNHKKPCATIAFETTFNSEDIRGWYSDEFLEQQARGEIRKIMKYIGPWEDFGDPDTLKKEKNLC